MSAREFARAEGVGLPDERSEELCEAKSQEAEPFSCLGAEASREAEAGGSRAAHSEAVGR